MESQPVLTVNYLSTYSVLCASQFCSILVYSSSSLSMTVKIHPLTLFGPSWKNRAKSVSNTTTNKGNEVRNASFLSNGKFISSWKRARVNLQLRRTQRRQLHVHWHECLDWPSKCPAVPWWLPCTWKRKRETSWCILFWLSFAPFSSWKGCAGDNDVLFCWVKKRTTAVLTFPTYQASYWWRCWDCSRKCWNRCWTSAWRQLLGLVPSPSRCLWVLEKWYLATS